MSPANNGDGISKVTLDTNVVLEHWRQRQKANALTRLLDLAWKRQVDLVVTSRVRENMLLNPLARELSLMPGLGATETASQGRFDYFVSGRDVLEDDRFVVFAKDVEGRDDKESPDWRDWDHLHAHFLLHRDVFLTWDERMLDLAEELRAEFGILVTRPEDWLSSVN